MAAFFLLIIAIYFFSRRTVWEIFRFLRSVIPSEKTVLAIIALILLPGTVVHEISHLLAALLLMLPVKGMNIFPVFNEREIRLGEVRFDRRDPVRGALVGVAPFFFGVLILALIFYFKIFPAGGVLPDTLLSYIIFSISVNIFSSNQDLKDLVFTVPPILIIFLVMYLFDAKVDLTALDAIMKEISGYLIYVLGINIIFFLAFKLINNIKRK